MNIHNVTQGSVEWALLRAGIATASEFDQLLTPELEPRKGQMPKTYLARKLAEWWQGAPLDAWDSFDMDQGRLLEREAIPWIELTQDVTVQRPGFITTDDGRFGCSPDGLVGEMGLEIKCPRIETHVGYLLRGELPKDYRPQVFGSMFVTGLHVWRFVSYCRRMPALVVEAESDATTQANILDALECFHVQFEHGKQTLIELNGGPPGRLCEKNGILVGHAGRTITPDDVAEMDVPIP